MKKGTLANKVVCLLTHFLDKFVKVGCDRSTTIYHTSYTVTAQLNDQVSNPFHGVPSVSKTPLLTAFTAVICFLPLLLPEPLSGSFENPSFYLPFIRNISVCMAAIFIARS